jgi:ubiquitin-protein ligase
MTFRKRIPKVIGVLALVLALTVATSSNEKIPSVVTTSTAATATTSTSPASESSSTSITSTGSSRHDSSSSQASESSVAFKSNKPSPKKNKRKTVPVVSTNVVKKAKPIKTALGSPASASLRRIKKEYKDAVQTGIAYDWVKQRKLTQTTSSRRRSSTSTSSISNNKNEEEHHHIICLGPLATNLRHWHFSFRGCGIYDVGIYHGRILLPKDYPATPPRVQLWTPSGRFIPYADICLSASAYHPESWTPRWTVLSLVQALRLHMLTNAQEIGGMASTVEETKEYAKESLAWKISWRAGKSILTVDHALILQQGVLKMEEEEATEPVVLEGGKDGGDSKISESGPVEGLDADTSSNDVPPSKDASAIDLDDERQDDVVDHDLSSSSPPSEDGATQQITTTTTSARKKKPKKSKTSHGTKHQRGGDATPQKRRPQKVQREEKSSHRHVLLLTISKVFATPARVAIFSLALLLWILCIP